MKKMFIVEFTDDRVIVTRAKRDKDGNYKPGRLEYVEKDLRHNWASLAGWFIGLFQQLGVKFNDAPDFTK